MNGSDRASQKAKCRGHDVQRATRRARGQNKCSYSKAWPDESHSTGGAERYAYLKSEFGAVQPLVFGHFGELNNRFLQLIDRLAESISNQHHRVHGWKSAKAGMCHAKVSVV